MIAKTEIEDVLPIISDFEPNGHIYTLNPSLWAKEQLNITLDKWQEDVLNSNHKRKVLNCSRQSGKSTVAAIKALHRAIHYNKSLILLISPSLRQSSELFRKVAELYNTLPGRQKLAEDNRLSMMLRSGSRIVSLPSSESTIRGYSNVDLIIEDESAAVPDDLISACTPMLAVSNGEYIQLSTPRGKKGHFWDAWQSTDWERTTITADQVPRISKEFLELERRNRGSRIYSQEYMCQFLDVAGAGMFRREWFPIVDSYPKEARIIRRWDKAATAEGGDYTAGLKLAEHKGIYYIVDVRHIHNTPGQNESLIRQTAQVDGILTKVRMEEEGGSSGKDTTDHYAREVLKGFDFKGVRSTGSKIIRAEPVSAAAEAGNIKIVRGNWDVNGLLDELTSFPEGEFDDQVDALSGAYSDFNTALNSNRFIGYVGHGNGGNP